MVIVVVFVSGRGSLSRRRRRRLGEGRLAGRRLAQRRLAGGSDSNRGFAGGRVGRGGNRAFLRVLRDHLAALTLAAVFFAPLVQRVDAARDAAADRFDNCRKEPSERELRRHDDRQKNQRQDDDQRTGSVQIVGELTRQKLAGRAAG